MIPEDVYPYCSVCGDELTEEEKQKNSDHSNPEYPICDSCIDDTIIKIEYIVQNG